MSERCKAEQEEARRTAKLLIDNYLDRICAQVKAKELHPELREELRGHIDELMAEREEDECSPNEAAVLALEQMGDAEEVGSTLGQVHKPKFNWPPLIPFALITGLSLLALFSLSAAGEGIAKQFNFGLNQLFAYGLGLIAMIVCFFFDYRWLNKYAVWLYAATAGLSLILFKFASVAINGTKSWVSVGPFMLNWTLCMFVLFLLALPGIFARLNLTASSRSWNSRAQLLAVGAMLLPLAVYIYFGLLAWLMLFAYAAAALTLYVRSGGSRFYLYLLPAAAFGSLSGLYVYSESWRQRIGQRIGAVFAPHTQTPDSVYLNEKMAEAIRESGWFGHGFGASGASIVYPSTDAILPYLTYSFGWSAAALLVASVVGLIVLLLRSARSIADNHGRLLVGSLSVFLGVQWIYGIAASFGLLPFTMLDMPLIGYGGYSTLVYCAIFGLTLGIYRRKDTIPAAGKKARAATAGERS